MISNNDLKHILSCCRCNYRKFNCHGYYPDLLYCYSSYAEKIYLTEFTELITVWVPSLALVFYSI